MSRTEKRSVPNGFLAMIVLVIFISGIAVMLVSGHKLNIRNNSSSDSKSAAENTSSYDSVSGLTSDAVAPNAFEDKSNLPGGYKTISVLNEDIFKGQLILVNYQYESKIDGDNLINLYENVTSSVGVKEDDMYINNAVLKPMNSLFDDFKKAKGDTSILISSSYRSKNDQTKIYNDSVKHNGEMATAYYVAVPGYSEHQTGYCFDTAAYNYDDEMIELDGEGVYSWLVENCMNYGFILRYPDNKTNITGIGYEGWHFRYVGVPHSYFIKEHNLCLEEYIAGICSYTFDEGGLLIDKGDKGKWVVYYVPKQEAFNNTDVSVPSDSEKCSYTISGDNIGGFIVTVDVSKDPSNSLLEKAKTTWNFDSSSLIISDFVDYDPEKDTFTDTSSDTEDDWESDSFWDDSDDERFEYDDYYTEDDYDDGQYYDGDSYYDDNGEYY